jgi:hypothetical protein
MHQPARPAGARIDRQLETVNLSEFSTRATVNKTTAASRLFGCYTRLAAYSTRWQTKVCPDAQAGGADSSVSTWHGKSSGANPVIRVRHTLR